MKYRICKAKTERDFELIYAMDLMCFGKADGSLTSVEDTDGSDWWIVWDEEHNPVAYCGVVIFTDFAVHKRCGVMRAARGNGLQKKMLRTREDFAKKNGCELICTYVSVQNRISANNLINAGYRVYNPEHRWGGDDYLYVEKKLKPQV
jgi:GNAT superfamily N-acetyltransferase